MEIMQWASGHLQNLCWLKGFSFIVPTQRNKKKKKENWRMSDEELDFWNTRKFRMNSAFK